MANAAILQYEVSGVVTSRILMGGITDADTALPMGALVSLSFLIGDMPFSTGATDFSVDALYDTFDFVGKFGNFQFAEISPSSPVSDALLISNATPMGFFDRLALGSGALTGNVVASMEPKFIDFALDDTTSSVFTDVSAPTAVFASSFDSQFNFFFARNANSSVSARVFFEVTSIQITQIPEPACVSLLLIGSLSWSARRRARLCAMAQYPALSVLGR